MIMKHDCPTDGKIWWCRFLVAVPEGNDAVIAARVHFLLTVRSRLPCTCSLDTFERVEPDKHTGVTFLEPNP